MKTHENASFELNIYYVKEKASFARIGQGDDGIAALPQRSNRLCETNGVIFRCPVVHCLQNTIVNKVNKSSTFSAG